MKRKRSGSAEVARVRLQGWSLVSVCWTALSGQWLAYINCNQEWGYFYGKPAELVTFFKYMAKTAVRNSIRGDWSCLTHCDPNTCQKRLVGGKIYLGSRFQRDLRPSEKKNHREESLCQRLLPSQRSRKQKRMRIRSQASTSEVCHPS